MKIYVNVTDDDGLCAWYNSRAGESYLYDSPELIDWNTDEFVGTAFTTVARAKAAGSKARSMARWNGSVDPKVRFFRVVGGEVVETGFTRDGKIRK